MSSVNYYNSQKEYPDIQDLVLQRLLEYMFKLIYPEETFNPVNKKKRFILADFDSGDEVAIRKSIETHFNTNATFPFTAYNIGDEEQVEQKSHLQKYGAWYVPEFGMAVSSIPHAITIPMVTFYNTPFDWRRFSSISALDDFNLTRLWVPCYFNNVLTKFPMDVDFTITKGSYAFRYDEMLKTGQIYDINHSMRVFYHKFVLAQPSQVDPSGKQKPLPIYPVESIEVALKELNDRENVTSSANFLIKNILIPDNPTMLSSSPTNGETNVDKDFVNIIITFDSTMDETLLLNNIDIIPYFDNEKTLSADGKTLVIDPVVSLTANTQYEVLINTKAKSADGVALEDDIDIKFTTGV
jgi:hypothetical protein